MDLRRRNMMAKKRRLPSGYDELEWIESTGTQYLWTDILKIQEDPSYLKIEMDCIYGGEELTGWAFGVSIADSSPASYFIGRLSNFTYNKGNNTIALGQYIVIGENHYSVEFDNGNITFRLNDGIATATSSYKKINIESFGLFCRYATYPSPGFRDFTSIKMKKFVMYNRDGVISDFIPCVRRIGNFVSMFNVTLGSITNTKGNFIAGPKV